MSSEQQPLLPHLASPSEDAHRARQKRRFVVHGALAALVLLALVVFAAVWENDLPNDPHKAAAAILKRTPVIDGHIDLPIFVRAAYAYNTSAFDLNAPMPQHVDIPRLRTGNVGAFFWSVYMGCPRDDGARFVNPTNLVRDTLEQIDVSRRLIAQYPDTFAYATSPDGIRSAMRAGKIASLLGVEGAHQLSNSLAVLRQYHALGVRYVTLTHTCDNAFADGAVFARGADGGPGVNGGLSPIGLTLIREMARLGMLVDLSHTTDDTAKQAIAELARGGTDTPVMWSHSSARAVHAHPRNVPDDILALLSTAPDGEKGEVDGVVMVNFFPDFIAPAGSNPNVSVVADHIEHIARVAGKEHVGLGSDFDGIPAGPVGLEDVSKYPNLFAELLTRGWDRYALAGLAGGNFLRVFDKAERASTRIRAGQYGSGVKGRDGAWGSGAAEEVWAGRPDLPMRGWDL